jgi:diadenosine tetraphosphate (Ap4A) HIT family hydrolase
MTVRYIDVYEKSELEPAPGGYRYLDFLGGTKNLRCYLVPEHTPRIDFFIAHEDLLDESLQPIYVSENVIVRQDASYALPGFYIVSPTRHFRAIDEMSEKIHLAAQLVVYRVRSAMRSVLGVREIHLHYEEKPDPSTNVHYWLMPMRYGLATPGTAIARLNIKSYLRQFTFAEERENILCANQLMREHLAKSSLTEAERQLELRLSGSIVTL